MTISGRLTPPSVQDGGYGWEPASVDNFSLPGSKGALLSEDLAQKLARESWESSTSWLNAGRRVQWSDSLKAFQGVHPSGSKYHSGSWQQRSRLFRPKSRAMVRRDEAATASAFFSNEDVVSVQAVDDDDPKQQASAKAKQALLQFRLTKTIPWFLTIVGARQDCDVMGVCAAKAYWKYEEVFSHIENRFALDDEGLMNGKTEQIEVWKKLHDKPCVDLIAPENIRVDAGADWRCPVESSPYVIEAIPMYLSDVRQKIANEEWRPVSESSLRSSIDIEDDPTRRSREQGRVPGKDNDTKYPTDFAICWIHENVFRWEGRDWHFFTTGGACELLTDVMPLEEVYLHGMRPWVLGIVVVETHKTFPAGKVELVRDLQWAANDDWNLRFDNLKLNLNPRQFIRTGAATDLNDVKTFTPGKTVLLNTKEPMNASVMWDRPPPPGPEAYAEMDRINLDFDELTGAFTNSSVQASQVQDQSATGMHLMSGEASGLNEYELRVFAETFVEPLIEMLIKLEEAYETDPVILNIAAKDAQLFQKYGIDAVTDELLDIEVMSRVNVGIGATNPQMKLRNFLMLADAAAKLYGPLLVQGTNFEEVMKELFGLGGYKDGARFFNPGFDPRVAQLQQQMQEMQKGQKGTTSDPMRLEAAKVQAQSGIEQHKIQAQSDQHQSEMEFRKAQMAEQAENWRTMFKAETDMKLSGMPDMQQMLGQIGPGLGQLGQSLLNMHQHGEARHQLLAQHLQQHAQAIGELEAHIRAPRRVVRDAEGRVTGVEHGAA